MWLVYESTRKYYAVEMCMECRLTTESLEVGHYSGGVFVHFSKCDGSSYTTGIDPGNSLLFQTCTRKEGGKERGRKEERIRYNYFACKPFSATVEQVWEFRSLQQDTGAGPPQVWLDETRLAVAVGRLPEAGPQARFYRRAVVAYLSQHARTVGVYAHGRSIARMDRSLAQLDELLVS